MASATRPSDSEPDEPRGRGAERSSSESSDPDARGGARRKVNNRRVKCRARQVAAGSDWVGLEEAIISKLRKLDKLCEARTKSVRENAKQLCCNIFKGRRPEVPTIPCLAHKLRKSRKGIEVKVTPDTGATMTVIPWTMVERLKLDLNTKDNNYDLLTASGDRMTVLSTVILYLEPEGAGTRPVLGIVTDDLGDEEILLCYSDMRDWGLLCEDFPRVPKTTKKVKKVSTPRKNIKLPVAKKTSPVKAPRKKTVPDPRRGVSVVQSPGSSPRVEEPQISPSMNKEDQKEAEK